MLIYDTEVIKGIPNEEIIPNINYCKGWDDFVQMGISCLVFLWKDSTYVCTSMLLEKLNFTIDDLDIDSQCSIHYGFDMFRYAIANTDHIVGFNSKKFDDNLCKANGIEITTTYDLLEQVRLAAYGSTDYLDMPKGYSYSLGKIAIAFYN